MNAVTPFLRHVLGVFCPGSAFAWLCS